jgi:hypothetical protein
MQPPSDVQFSCVHVISHEDPLISLQVIRSADTHIHTPQGHVSQSDESDMPKKAELLSLKCLKYQGYIYLSVIDLKFISILVFHCVSHLYTNSRNRSVCPDHTTFRDSALVVPDISNLIIDILFSRAHCFEVFTSKLSQTGRPSEGFSWRFAVWIIGIEKPTKVHFTKTFFLLKNWKMNSSIIFVSELLV